MNSREASELRLANARARKILWITLGWVALGTLANWAVRGTGPVDALVFTIDTLAYLTKRQDGAAWFIQVVLLHGGTVITWYIGWYVVDLVMENHLWRNLRERKRMKEIEALSDHVIICGGGRVGEHLARLLAKGGVSFVVVDENVDRASELRELGYVVVEGDARDESVLRHAGATRAKRIVCALPNAERNVFVVLAAKRIKPDVRVDARCEDEKLAATLSQAGAERVILPERACAELLLE